MCHAALLELQNADVLNWNTISSRQIGSQFGESGIEILDRIFAIQNLGVQSQTDKAAEFVSFGCFLNCPLCHFCLARTTPGAAPGLAIAAMRAVFLRIEE